MSVRETLSKVSRLAQTRADGWVNLLSGYGTEKDAVAMMKPTQFIRFSDHELEQLYMTEPLANRVVGLVVDEATRQGWELSSEKDDKAAKELHEKLESKFNYQEEIAQYGKESRLYGHGYLFFRVDDGADWSSGAPLRIEQIKKVSGFEFLPPSALFAREYSMDILSPGFGKPKTYDVQFQSTRAHYYGQNHHHSRFMVIDQGIKLTKWHREERNRGGSESVLGPIFEVLQRYRTSLAASISLINNMSQGVYKLKNFNKILGGSDNEKELLSRMMKVDLLRSTVNSIILDSDGESFERITTPLSELSSLIDRMMLDMSQASGIPMTRLFGMSPAGLNATGESDIRNWYDTVQSYREMYLAKVIRGYMRVASADPDVPSIPDDVKIVWPPLWQMSPLEISTTKMQVAQSDVSYIQTGVFSPEEIQQARAHKDGWMRDIQVIEPGDDAFDIDLLSEDDAGDFKLEDDAPAKTLPTPAPVPAVANAEVAGDPESLASEVASSEDKAVQDFALNGAQVTALLSVVQQAAAGLIPRDTAVQTIVSAFPAIPEEQAERIVGSIGRGFVKPEEGSGGEVAG